MKWLFKWATGPAYGVFFGLLIVAVSWAYLAIAEARHQKDRAVMAKVHAESAAATAEKKLSDRAAIEAAHVASAVEAARKDERRLRREQDERYAKLQESELQSRVALGDAQRRLLQRASESTRGPTCTGSGGVTRAAPATGRATPAREPVVPAADRRLIDELLRIGKEADDVARERNALAEAYIANCERSEP